MERIQSSLRDESISRLQDQLKTLESRHAEHVNTMNALATEIASINEEIARLERGVPMESARSLKYSRKIRKA